MNQSSNLPKSIHFLGIGGAGMNPLAGICLKNGVNVTGSDSTQNTNQDELKILGADIWTPHSLEELQKRPLPEVCAYSTAIPPSNPEFAYLKENGVEFWHRSDLLQKIANQFEKQIVISGTHGKTTTTAMLIWMLEKAGLKPCWVLGGVLKGLGSYGWNNDQREIFIFEGDESDQSFLKSNPYIGLVTSLEPDHLENYQNSFEVQIKKFQEFAQKSKIFICGLDCANNRSYLMNFAKIKYAQLKYSEADWQIIDAEDLILPKNNKDWQGPISLSKAPGYHNSLNALGAMSALYELTAKETDEQNICKTIADLSSFPGIYRRFEIIGKTENGITVIDDYAHHPTEVKASINAGRRYLHDQKLGGRLIVAFQPHLPTRLRDLWKEFTTCFEGADMLFLADLYIARGEPIPGIDSKHLAAEIKHTNLVYVQGPSSNLVKPLTEQAQRGDLILILGAGDITKTREEILQKLEEKNKSSIEVH